MSKQSAPKAEVAGLTVERREEIAAKWLQQCGPCDAGLPMECSHPSEDYRPVMAALLDALAAAEAEVKHWKDHAEEAGRGFSLVCKDAARLASRNVRLVESAARIKAERDEARAAVAIVRGLLTAAEHASLTSHARTFDGSPFPALIPADHLRAALDTATSEGA